jgi:holliday junction DNA helicase RuvA
VYDHLRGSLTEKQPTRVVLSTGGVGYELTIPLSSFESLPDVDTDTILYTHLYVREDALRLFGFATRDERRFFRRLLEVQGIGPAVALSILSSTRYADFRDAVLSEDVALLTRLKGVGKKLAQRIVLDLRDTLLKETPDQPRSTGAISSSALREDGIAALSTLGFTRSAAAREVDRILGKGDGSLDLGDLVRQALRSTR